MKTAFPIRTLVASLCLIATLITGCRRNTDDPAPDTFTQDDAADLVTGSVSSASYGLTSQTTDATNMSTSSNGKLQNNKSDIDGWGDVYAAQVNFCNAPVFDTTITRSGSNTQLGTSYSYSIRYNYGYSCSGTPALPQGITLNITTNGTYASKRISSRDNATGTLSGAGVQAASTTITFNGNYTRQAATTFLLKTSVSTTTTLQITLSNLVVLKSTRVIQSGAGTFTLTGTSSNGGSINFTGSIAYQGNGQATITINGKTYSINLNQLPG